MNLACSIVHSKKRFETQFVILDWVEHGRFTGQFVRNIHTASVTLLELNSNGFDIKYVSNTTHLDATS